jgi:hypothetical protein
VACLLALRPPGAAPCFIVQHQIAFRQGTSRVEDAAERRFRFGNGRRVHTDPQEGHEVTLGTRPCACAESTDLDKSHRRPSPKKSPAHSHVAFSCAVGRQLPHSGSFHDETEHDSGRGGRPTLGDDKPCEKGRPSRPCPPHKGMDGESPGRSLSAVGSFPYLDAVAGIAEKPTPILGLSRGRKVRWGPSCSVL